MMGRIGRIKGARFAATCALLAGLAVRLYNLTYHGLWFDEAMSVHWAKQTPARIVEVSMALVEDRLPPLYYLSLHYWRALFGDGEFSLRLMSAFAGVLSVAAVYRVGRELFGRRAGAAAAMAAAFNPFLVWYSQEARMYAFAALFGLMGAFCILMAIRSGRLSWWAGYVLFGVAGLYTHLYTAFLLVAEGIYMLATARQRRKSWPAFAAAALVIAAAFSPLALANWRASAEAGPGEPFAGAIGRAWWLLEAFTAWKSPPGMMWQVAIPLIPIFVGVLAAVGVTAGAARGRRKEALFTALMVVVPFLLAEVLQIRSRLTFYGERYFIVAVPFLLVAAGAGVEAWRRPGFATAASILLVAASIAPLPGLWTPENRKEAWREVAAYLHEHARPEDAILIHPDWVRYPFQYYHDGPGQTYALYSSVEEEGTDLDGPLGTISGGHPVVWLVESHLETPDPERRVEGWFASRFPLVTELYPNGVTLKAYAPGYISDAVPQFAKPLMGKGCQECGDYSPADACFEGGLCAAAYSLDRPAYYAKDDVYHPPSGWVHLTVWWYAEDAPLHEDYTPFAHLVDGAGGVWGASLERQASALRMYPPTRWEDGQFVREDYDVNLNPETPTGTYGVVVGLPGSGGGVLRLAEVGVIAGR